MMHLKSITLKRSKLFFMCINTARYTLLMNNINPYLIPQASYQVLTEAIFDNINILHHVKINKFVNDYKDLRNRLKSNK